MPDEPQEPTIEEKLLKLEESLKTYEDRLTEKDAELAKLTALNQKLTDNIVNDRLNNIPQYQRQMSEEEIYNDTLDSIANAIRDKYIPKGE